MDHTVFVRVCERVRDLHAVPDDVLCRQPYEGMRPLRGCPAMYSIARYGRPSNSPTS